MCDCPVTGCKEDCIANSCLVNLDYLNVGPPSDKDDDFQDMGEKPMTEEMMLNLQTANRWLREVDPGFSAKSQDFSPEPPVLLEPQPIEEKVIVPQIFYHAIPITYETYKPPKPQKPPKPKKSKKLGKKDPERMRRLMEEIRREHEALSTIDLATATFGCDICKRNFTRQSNLTEHMTRHTGRVYTCEICHKKFSCARYVTRHRRLHTGETAKQYEEIPPPKKHTGRAYTCTTCSKEFTCKSHLVDHMRIHTGEKPYSCDSCPKTFNHKSHLKSHIRTHTGEKPYQCRLCQKKFRDQSNLSGHMRVHNGQKPFACQTCQELFSHRAHLKKHERAHLQLKYPCKVCGKEFTEPAKLRCHSKSHDEKTFTCNFCNNKYTTKTQPFACDPCTKQLTQRMKIQEINEENRLYAHYAAHAC